jgi:hypothetical protein
MCDICADTGYVMQDIGTATIPDYIEVPCACNPDPFGTACEDFVRFNGSKYESL